MSTRNLDALFEARSIVLVGASNRSGSVGEVLARNMLEAGFGGPLFAVNPHDAAILSIPTYKSVAELPVAPDLAIIATPSATVPGLIRELVDKGCRAAVVITAGLSAEPLKQQMLDAARSGLLRIVGPNCLGFLSPELGINASFAHLTPKRGGLALVAQSGAVTTAALDWASGRGFGFSRVVTLGDMADVDFGDVLDYLALDPATTAILLYVESITKARKFMSAARIAARLKPVVVVKAGRSAAGAKAAYSHTGALAGSDLVYDAAFRRAGMLRVGELREMFDAVATLSAGLRVRGDRLAVLTNGGGAGVMAADALDAAGGRLAILDASSVTALSVHLPSTWSHANPVDIIGDAPPERYARALEILFETPGSDAILVLNCPTALASGDEAARVVTAAVRKHRDEPPILTCWLGDPAARPARTLLTQAGIPTYETPEEAVRAFMHLADHHRNQTLLSQTPPASDGPPDRTAAAVVFALAESEGREFLTEPEAKAIFKAYGIPVLESRAASDPADAAIAAGELAGPYALKILSRDITHKTDVGGVVLNLQTSRDVEAAAQTMLARVAAAAPEARLDGFIVQSMAIRPLARELIVGVAADPVFGPVILFGWGGVEVEVLADRTMGFPPLNRMLALDMISRTRVAKRLAAFRDRPAADLDAVADVLVRLASLALDFPTLAELDINPLLADDRGVLALDARVRLGAAGAQPAIRPYPDDIAHAVVIGGQDLLIRPILPQDEPGLIDLVARSTPEDLRFRFRAGLRELPHAWAARLSQIDYDREMALVAVADGSILGVARLAGDPEGENAEFALFVRSDRQNLGLGRLLLADLLDVARRRGIRRVWGEVMAGNRNMLELTEAMGLHREPSGDRDLVRVAVRWAGPLDRPRPALVTV